MSAYDLVVIGSGPGGYVAAIRAAQLGMRTAIVEADRLGGVCLNWGCIPSKAILHAAELFDAVRRGVPGLRAGSLEADFAEVIAASRKAADRLARGVAALMRKNGIEVVQGRGAIAGPGVVRVAGSDGDARELRAARILLATGSRDAVLPGVEVDGERVQTSREAIVADRLPESIVIVGAGAVGLEFGYAYAVYGCKVTIVEMAEQVLPGIDREAAEAVASAFARRGVTIRTRTRVRSVESNAEGVLVGVEGEKGEEELAAERVLLAVGRRACTEGLGLEDAGVELERGFVRVNARYETSVPGIFAIGDLIGPPMLAHAASEEGVAAVEMMAGIDRRPVDPRHIPVCIYCQPQVASVGLSEERAREEGYDVRVGRFPFAASGKAVATGATHGFAKIVVDARYGEILGCHVVGEGATELVAEATVAMRLESTVRELAETPHAHPTLSEAIKEAALAAEGRAINA